MSLAIVFPGQGSQSVGMMQGFSSPLILKLYQEASEIVGEDLFKLINEENELLNQTIYTQPIMLIAGYACWQLMYENNQNIDIKYVSGHSLGEITALLASEVLDLQSALKIVKKRAQLMQDAVPTGVGAMAAILGLEDEAVEEICRDLQNQGVIEPVNYNSPGQLVIAGEKNIIEASIDIFKQKGAKRALILPVSVPSHCSLMTDAAHEFSEYCNEFTFNEPKYQLIQNVNAKIETNPENIKINLAKQLHHPVLWTKTIQIIEQDNNVKKIVECGPGKVLSGLNKRIINREGLDLQSINNDESLNI
ncbi:MAG: ACP S-malonyltransferase [Nitrosomonadales bacterium]